MLGTNSELAGSKSLLLRSAAKMLRQMQALPKDDFWGGREPMQGLIDRIELLHQVGKLNAASVIAISTFCSICLSKC